MASIADKLTQIRQAIFGKDVRESIASGIELINEEVENTTEKQELLETEFDQLIINAGDSNAEIVQSRVEEDGTVNTSLKARLDKKEAEFSTQLEEKAQKTQTNDLQAQVNNLVINGTGDSNPEVIQSRTDYDGNTFNVLKDTINNLYNVFYDKYSLLSFGDWIQGAIQSDGSTNTNTSYIRTNNFHYINQPTEVTLDSGTELRLATYDSSGTIVSIGNFSSNKIYLIPNENRKYKFCLHKTDNSTFNISESIKLKMKYERYINYNAKGSSFITINSNLIDNYNMLKGYLINASTGAVEVNSLYDTTDFIDYTLIDTLTVSRYRSYCIYDQNKNRLLVNTTETTNKSSIFYNPASNASIINAKYIRFSFRKPYGDNAMLSKADYTDVTEYGYFMNKLRITPENFSNSFKSYMNDIISQISISISNPLIGKILLVLGDSIMAGNEVSGVGIGERISALNEMTLIKRALGGATMAVVTGSTNNIVAQVNNSVSNSDNPDYIILNGLTNDIGGSSTIQLGDITSGFSATLDTSTFSGAMEYVLKTLINAYPSAKILYLRPHNMSSRNAQKQIDFGNRAIEICKKYSKKYLNLYDEGGLNTNITSLRDLFTVNSDGTHYNSDGYDKFLVNQVNSELKMI